MPDVLISSAMKAFRFCVIGYLTEQLGLFSLFANFIVNSDSALLNVLLARQLLITHMVCCRNMM